MKFYFIELKKKKKTQNSKNKNKYNDIPPNFYFIVHQLIFKMFNTWFIYVISYVPEHHILVFTNK